MGTPDFAIPSLKALYHGEHEVVAVVTQPDRPRGRGQQSAPPPVKKWALEKRIPILQPASLKENDFLQRLKGQKPDVVTVVAYGNIIPWEILELPRLGCINVHPSLLPRYRGASPIQSAILNGEEVTGVSVIFVVPELDAGDIILQEQEPIHPHDCAGDLHNRLAEKGAKLLSRAVDMIAREEVEATPQEPEYVTYAAPLQKSDQFINWSDSGTAILNRIRAMSPVPGACTFYKGKRIKIREAVLLRESKSGEGAPGEVVKVDEEGIEVAAGEGSLLLRKVQPEGKKEMHAADFSRGYHLGPGDTFSVNYHHL